MSFTGSKEVVNLALTPRNSFVTADLHAPSRPQRDVVAVRPLAGREGDCPMYTARDESKQPAGTRRSFSRRGLLRSGTLVAAAAGVAGTVAAPAGPVFAHDSAPAGRRR